MLNLPFIRALSALLDNTTMLLDLQESYESDGSLQTIGFDF